MALPTREEYYIKKWKAKFRALMEAGESNVSVRTTAWMETHMQEMALKRTPPWRTSTHEK